MNRLINETSPYLLQHAHNPVDWFPWGTEALEKARKEDKLLLISIGYAACHWCHVMEKESFENEEVAAIMNENFVCIKIDREERPDIDKIYMDAVILMYGQGGWPLNCIALPDGRPIYGGTYFQREQWKRVMAQVSNLYRNKPDDALEYAQKLTDAIHKISVIKENEHKEALEKADIHNVLAEWKESIDENWGGFQSERNKFPLPTNWRFLLQMLHFSKDENAQALFDNTLKRMMLGGIYDQIGGGFSRYSVDTYWQVPHFEKMLYDNAQLLSLYAEAYQQKPNKDYQRIVYQTITFVERELSSPEGGFYASLDADSEGVEGKFYIWTEKEIREILGEEAQLCIEYFHIRSFGNWENGQNTLFATETISEFAQMKDISEEEFVLYLEEAKTKLMQAREKKIRPALDDKILTSWNALMLKGLVDSYKAFGEEEWLQRAIQNAEFIWQNVTESIPRAINQSVKVGTKIYRNYKNGKRSIRGFLDDYAFTMQAFIALYEVTFDAQWIAKAEYYLHYVLQHFYDEETGMFFYTEKANTELIVRKYETSDDVIPAACSALANVLWNFSLLKGEPKYKEMALRMLENVKDGIISQSRWHANWGILALKTLYPQYEVVVTGENALTLRKELMKPYRPNVLFAGATEIADLEIVSNRITDNTLIYVCKEMACQLPVKSVAEAELLMAE